MGEKIAKEITENSIRELEQMTRELNGNHYVKRVGGRVYLMEEDDY